ncbi:hypothetical protein ES705_46015 [subsurface metagenome]
MEVAKGGYREDLKQYFRSKMEANVARYYKYFGELYIYEYWEFEFKRIKRGSRFYKPDFFLAVVNHWVEVKGRFSDSDKTKLRRFKKYYPEEFKRLRFIIPDKYGRDKANGEMVAFLIDELGIEFRDIESYKEMEKFRGIIPGWE